MKWSNFFGANFLSMFLSLLKPQKRTRKKKAKAASSQPASNTFANTKSIKIQPIVPNTFSNKESIAHKDSLHNLLEKVYSLYFIVRGGGRGFTNHLSTLEKKTPTPSTNTPWSRCPHDSDEVWNFLHPSGAAKRRFSSWKKQGRPKIGSDLPNGEDQRSFGSPKIKGTIIWDNPWSNPKPTGPNPTGPKPFADKKPPKKKYLRNATWTAMLGTSVYVHRFGCRLPTLALQLIV